MEDTHLYFSLVYLRDVFKTGYGRVCLDVESVVIL